MRRSRGSARAARSSWAKWFNIRTRIGSATSEGRNGFSSDSPKSSAECRSLGTTTRVAALFLAKTSCVPTLALADGSLRQWEHRSTSRSSRGCYFFSSLLVSAWQDTRPKRGDPMGLFGVIGKHLQHPKGLLGKALFGWMTTKTIAHARWTADLMDVQPDDDLLEVGFGNGTNIELLAERAS